MTKITKEEVLEVINSGEEKSIATVKAELNSNIEELVGNEMISEIFDVVDAFRAKYSNASVFTTPYRNLIVRIPIQSKYPTELIAPFLECNDVNNSELKMYIYRDKVAYSKDLEKLSDEDFATALNITNVLLEQLENFKNLTYKTIKDFILFS